MNTVKKIVFENLPQDFSPHTLPEILKLAKKIKDDTALIYERLSKPFFMETDRLIIAVSRPTIPKQYMNWHNPIPCQDARFEP